MTRLLIHVPRRYPGHASCEIAASDSRRSFSAQYRRSRSHLAVALASVGHCVTDFVSKEVTLHYPRGETWCIRPPSFSMDIPDHLSIDIGAVPPSYSSHF